MARKTAIRITSAELAAEEYRAESRRDIPTETAPESTLQLLRRVRDRMSERELLKLAREAARLELRGDQWDSEDRADCAAEVMWHVLAEHDGAPPLSDSPRARITHACGIAKNWRAAQLRRRAMEARAALAAEDAYALSPASMLDMIPDELSTGYVLAGAAQAIDAAHAAARAAIDRLELTPGGPVNAAFYQWARGASGDQCAAENGVSAATWRKRVERGGALIRAAFPDLGELCERLRASDPPSVYRRARIKWQDREGTDNGARAERAETAERARELCSLRHQCPTPGIAAAGRSLARRGYIKAAPMVRSAGERAPRGYVWVAGTDERRRIAQSLAIQARSGIRPGARERAVNPRDVQLSSH